MIVGNLVRNFNVGGNFPEYDINMGICMSDHFCGGTGTPETSELDDIYLHGSRCFIGKSYGGKRYLCGA